MPSSCTALFLLIIVIVHSVEVESARTGAVDVVLEDSSDTTENFAFGERGCFVICFTSDVLEFDGQLRGMISFL